MPEKEVEAWQLLLYSPSLLNSFKRENYQCEIWKRSLEAFPQIPSSGSFGWTLDKGKLIVDWSARNCDGPTSTLLFKTMYSKNMLLPSKHAEVHISM